MSEIRRVELEIPSDARVVNHEFYNYDPSLSFSVANSLKYLSEDLFQCAFPSDDLIIDMGWYGNPVDNQGEFKILVIKNENWEIPANTIHAKSSEETKTLLNKILQFYTNICKLPKK